MIIICPACDTKFMLSASALGTEGREVRCAKCSHQWHAMPDQKAPEAVTMVEAEDSPAPAPHDDIDESILEALTAAATPPASRPRAQKSLAENPVWKIASACLVLCMLALMLILGREALQPALSPIYSAMGYYPTEDVVLADVNLRELPSRRKKRYEIECTILNNTKETRNVPQLSMQILNESGEVLAEEESFLENTGQPIPKGKSVPCKGLRFENIFSTAHTIVMDAGSPMELSLRSGWDFPSEDDESGEGEDANATEEETPTEEDPQDD